MTPEHNEECIEYCNCIAPWLFILILLPGGNITVLHRQPYYYQDMCHRITVHQRLESISGERLSQLFLLKEESMRPDFSEPCPIRFCQSISEDGDSTACPGNLFQCWTTITVKSVFLYLCGIPSLCPLNFVLSLHITEKNVPLSLLFSNLKSHTYLSSCLYITSSSPFIIFEFSGLFPVAPHPSCTVEHRTGQKTPDVASPVLSRGKGLSPPTYRQHSS